MTILLHIRINILVCTWEQKSDPYVNMNIYDLGKKLKFQRLELLKAHVILVPF